MCAKYFRSPKQPLSDSLDHQAPARYCRSKTRLKKRGSLNILIVDDSRLLRLSNERTLVKAGHNVTSAEDGEAGLRLALENKPDIIVLDMMLPKLSGQDVLRALRQNPGTSNIPVLVLSGLPQCNESKLISEGATAYFQKSGLLVENGPSLFLEEVERLLAKSVIAKAAAAGR